MTGPTLSPAAEAALNLIRRNGTGTSFIEIVAAIDAAGIPTDGNHALCSGNDPNIILWAGITEEVVDGIKELLRGGHAHLHPTTVMVYLADGGMLDFPVVQRPPAAGYKEPHWLPAVVNAGPDPDKTAKKPSGRGR